MNKSVFCLCLLGITLGLLVGSSPARASGFALLEQSGKGLGEAYSGGITDIKDASSIFSNPSAIAFMEGNEVTTSLNVINISSEFKDDGSTLGSGTGIPLTGGDSGDAGTTGIVPTLYWAQGLTDRIKVGLGVNAPYGLATKYDKTWKGRYHAIESDLMSVGISPTLAFQVIPDLLSLGASVNAQYLDAKLTNAIDFGSILYAAGAGTLPQSLDGEGDMTGDDWGVGYSLGLLCKLAAETRVGVSYRSKVDHTLEGKIKFEVPATARTILDQSGMSTLFVDSDVKANLTTPETVSLGLYQGLGEAFAVTADVTWTRWSRFNELRAETADAVLLDPTTGLPTNESVTEENWNDTFKYSLGLNYFLSDTWTLRTGTCYDQSPIDTEYRTPRIPGNDRLWLSLGASWQILEDLRADLGYAHLFMSDPKSDLQVNPTDSHLVGKYEAAVDIYSMQVALYF